MNTELLIAIVGSIAGVLTAAITAIITRERDIKTARINAAGAIVAEYAKERKTRPSPEEVETLMEEVAPVPRPLARVNWPLVMAVGLAVGLVLWLLARLLPVLAEELPTSPDALVFNFESDIAPDEWTIGVGEATLSLSQDHAFAGRSSLAVNVELLEHVDKTDTIGTVELTLSGRNVQDQLAVSRIYAAEDAPTNLQAGFFIRDANKEWRNGSTVRLTPGKWSTLVWSTQDAPDWESPATLGIQFALLVRTPSGPDTEKARYSGTIFVDLVEVLALPDIYSHVPTSERMSLDRILEPLISYDFEDTTTVPESIAPGGKTSIIMLTDEASLPDGQKALRLDLDLIPYDNKTETGWGGIHVDLGGSKRVEAIGFSVLIPDQNGIRAGDLNVFVMAVDQNGNAVYSGSLPLPVGEWSSQFWGPRYAYAGPILCPDSDRNGQCDEPAVKWWDHWTETYVTRFDIRIWRGDGEYKGPVYIDNLAAYQVRP